MQLPETLLQELRSVPGFHEQEFIAAHDSPPQVSLRLNPGKNASIFSVAEHIPWAETGRYLNERPVFTLDPLFHAGAYYVQEASSMFLEHLLREAGMLKPGLRVLDLCASPGGKSTHLASLLDDSSLLVSNEVIRPRATVLEENMTKWGRMNTWVSCNDPRSFGRLPGYFDVVVVDAPCSGSGLFRRHPDWRAEWTEANVQLCGERQQRILADVWPSLKQGGVMIYCTCSYSASENEDMLDWMAAELGADALQVPVADGWGLVATCSDKRKLPGYRFFPHRVKGEGFFIAALRKTGEAGEVGVPRQLPQGDKKALQAGGYLFNYPGATFIQIDADEYSCINQDHINDWQALGKALYLRKAGTRAGMPTAKEWLPAHDTALSVHGAAELPYVELDRDQALRFLKKEDFGNPAGKGWHMAKHRGLGLGWVKLLGNRVNNYLPKHWRIRMDIDKDE